VIVVRLLGFAFLVIVAFCAAIAGLLLATGKLNRETYEILAGKRPPVEVEQQKPDDVDVVSRALREQKETLEEQKKQLDERDNALKIREDDLRKRTTEMQQLIEDLRMLNEQINQAEDAERTERRTDIAKILSKAKPKSAAVMLGELDRDTAVAVFRLVEDKVRGKILDEMDPKLAAELLKAMEKE
jgi:flagellar motility protein MotE (MotC chaperone)